MSLTLKLAQRLAATLNVTVHKYQSKDFARNAVYFSIDTELWVFPAEAETVYTSVDTLNHDLSELLKIEPPEGVTVIRYVVTTLPNLQNKINLRLGHEAISSVPAIHKLLDLPATFSETQTQYINEAFSSVASLPGGPVKTRAVIRFENKYTPEQINDVFSLVNSEISSSNHGLYFIEAEAGKGKTVLLSMIAQYINNHFTDRLCIYIPLRRLPIQSATSLESIMQLIGVVGAGAERLKRAIKNGLVITILDGIDEVSGRYDRSVIQDLLLLLTKTLSGTESISILSGRKTEARQLNPDQWKIIGIELPYFDSSEFKRYVKMIVTELEKDWDKYIPGLPDGSIELLTNEKIDAQAHREIDSIIDWIIAIFPSVGKDASLFFVQGLAAIGINSRINNKRILSYNDNQDNYIPSLTKLCLTAALFACLREQSKIEDFAKKYYTVANQMNALYGFSVLSSAQSIGQLPTPNEIARQVFHIDTTNNNEEYTAILRQNAKHALLYATEAATGAYQPKFLSDWIRCAFLANILIHPEIDLGIDKCIIYELIGSADRARYTFSSLLPELFSDDEKVPRMLITAMTKEARNGSETACANLWQLRAAIGDDEMDWEIPNPLHLAQLEQAEFTGCTIGEELSGEYFFLDDCQFLGANISDVQLVGVSMTGVVFRNCKIINLELEHCDGPIYFDNCKVANCLFLNTKSYKKPALYFNNCRIECDDIFAIQNIPTYGTNQSSPLLEFSNCTTNIIIDDYIKGNWLHNSIPVTGIEFVENPSVDPAIECLHETLNTFFPYWGGEDKVQARDYIRLSALGRGFLPEGSPSRDELQQYLISVGFKAGGRSDHIYGPWSSVVGGGDSGRKIRSELIDFMRDKTIQGPTVKSLLKKINRHFS